MGFIDEIIEKVKGKGGKIVFPEGFDPRVLKATEIILKNNIADEVYLPGNPDQIKEVARQEGIDISKAILFDNTKTEVFDEYVQTFYELRKHKNISMETARKMISDPVFYGAMMLRKGEVDAMVSGSMSPTAKIVRAALYIVKTAEGVKTVSGSFAMIVPDKNFGADGRFIYADSGVVPNPTPEQLADIAVSSAETARKLYGIEPIVAFLSFSTKGSADHPDVRKVQEAVEILRSRNPDFVFDGEMQVDAAIVPSVAEKKCPGSPVKGRANVLIFPDLDAGNIAYKLTQRLAHAEAYGPLLQGVARPLNDLSRGCSVEDIVGVAAITLAQAFM